MYTFPEETQEECESWFEMITKTVHNDKYSIRIRSGYKASVKYDHHLHTNNCNEIGSIVNEKCSHIEGRSDVIEV